jgi:hypothetical protein
MATALQNRLKRLEAVSGAGDDSAGFLAVVGPMTEESAAKYCETLQAR